MIHSLIEIIHKVLIPRPKLAVRYVAMKAMGPIRSISAVRRRLHLV